MYETDRAMEISAAAKPIVHNRFTFLILIPFVVVFNGSTVVLRYNMSLIGPISIIRIIEYKCYVRLRLFAMQKHTSHTKICSQRDRNALTPNA